MMWGGWFRGACRDWPPRSCRKACESRRSRCSRKGVRSRRRWTCCMRTCGCRKSVRETFEPCARPASPPRTGSWRSWLDMAAGPFSTPSIRISNEPPSVLVNTSGPCPMASTARRTTWSSIITASSIRSCCGSHSRYATTPCASISPGPPRRSRVWSTPRSRSAQPGSSSR